MLHKTSRLLGFHLLAADGEIGHVDDFLVDERFAVRYLVVDTSKLDRRKAGADLAPDASTSSSSRRCRPC